MKETLTAHDLKAWLRKPDDRDLVPVRGVVMHLAAEEIERLEREVARLRKETGASAPPERITFQDGDRIRTLIHGADGYALPEGAETLADIRLAAFAEGAASISDGAREADQGPDAGDSPPAGQDAGETDRADEDIADATAGNAAVDGTAKGQDADDAKGEEDFELPPEWQ
ncbi:hypothetical protein KAJ83_15825 [Marivibrio halodurans]|uniref:Uncharacterized protein n=1 Tax=Marivibrio halodurans TaxID=2039722 RepID=A0A8J7S272_9PROT|nr:hypothetical protein [Marivibrio halodurans]MBP5858490.1 hypothetical protein [Marivibrio halodurans]